MEIRDGIKVDSSVTECRTRSESVMDSWSALCSQRLHMASHQTRGTRAHALASQVESFLLKRLRAISSLSLPTDGSSAAATYAAARPVMGCSAPDDVADVTPSQSALRS